MRQWDKTGRVTAKAWETAEQILPQALAYRTAIVEGGAAVMALAEEQF